jgi:sigma-70-like protein
VRKLGESMSGRDHKDNPNRDGFGLSREQIAEALGLSVVRVGQIERAALEKMRAHARPEFRDLLIKESW